MEWLSMLGVGVLSFIIVALVVRAAPVIGLLDIPNERSMHNRLTPRAGGLGFILSWSVFAITLASKNPESMTLLLPMMPAYLIAGFGLVDDKLNLPVALRLGLQLVAVITSLCWLMQTYPFRLWGLEQNLSVMLSGLAILWSVNLFNFMDGIDGFAAIEAIWVLGGSSLIFFYADANPLLWLCLALMSGVMGFLVWNWPQAKVFMGDVGSGFLGFLIAMIALLAELVYGIPANLWILLFALFWFDASITLCRRIYRKARITEGHRQHAYQRLVLSSMTTSKVLLGAMAINSGLLAITIFVYWHPEHFWGALFTVLLSLSLIYMWIEHRRPM